MGDRFGGSAESIRTGVVKPDVDTVRGSELSNSATHLAATDHSYALRLRHLLLPNQRLPHLEWHCSPASLQNN